MECLCCTHCKHPEVVTALVYLRMAIRKTMLLFKNRIAKERSAPPLKIGRLMEGNLVRSSATPVKVDHHSCDDSNGWDPKGNAQRTVDVRIHTHWPLADRRGVRHWDGTWC